MEVFAGKRRRRFFYDAENITYSPANTVGVWLKIVYSEKFKEQEELTHLIYTVGLWEIDCKEKKMCLLSTSHTSKEEEIAAQKIWLPLKWKSISTGTIMDTLYKKVCKEQISKRREN